MAPKREAQATDQRLRRMGRASLFGESSIAPNREAPGYPAVALR